jgi:hypothetical protein
MDLFNYKTGQWEEHAEDAELSSKIASGNFGFAKGLTIPVVTRDGDMATVPSEKLTIAFRQGDRLATAADADVAEAKGREESLNRLYGSEEGTAAALGVARTASFGLSDAALAASGLAPAVSEVKERNPVSSLAGEVAGAFVPFGAGAGAAMLGARAAAGTKAALGTTGAVARYGSALAKGAVEGAAFGAGQGVSESALGDPSELVENIAANGLQGALYGGLLGGAFQGAQDVSPFIKDVVKAGANRVDDAIGSTLRKGYKATVGKAVAARLGKEAGADFVSAVDDVTGRNALAATGDAAFKAAAREADEMGVTIKDVMKARKAEAAKLSREIEKEVGSREAQARQIIKNAPKEIQDELAAKSQQLGYDTAALIDDSVSGLEQASQKFAANLKVNYAAQPAQRIDKIVSAAENAAASLKLSGSRTAQALGKSLSDMVEAEVGVARKSGLPLSNAVDVPLEYSIAKRLRDQVDGYQLKPADQEAIQALQSRLDKDVLASHYIPELSGEINQLAARSKIVDDLRGQLSTAASPVQKLSAVAADPIRAKALDEALTRAEEFYPMAIQLRQGFANKAEKLAMLQDVQRKIRAGMMDSASGKLSIKDTEDVLNLLGKGTKADELVSASATAEMSRAQVAKMADEIAALKTAVDSVKGASTVDKYIAYARALGKDVGEEIQDLQKLSGLQDKIRRLKDISQETSRSELGAAAMWVMSPKIAAIAKAAETASNFGMNPARSLRTLGAMEKVSQASTKAVSAAISKTVDALVSGKTQKIVRAGSLAKMSMDKQKKDYARQKEILTQLADPEFAANYIEQRLPAMPEAPGIQSAMGTHIINTSAFLRSKLPEDPMQDTSIIIGQSDYEPSDTEMAQFLRYSAAAENPTQVIENIGALVATPEELETLQTLYPSIYKRLQDQVVSGITKSGTKLGYSQRMMVGEMFNLPTDYSLTPQFIQTMQTSYEQEMPDNPGGRPAGGGNTKIKINLDAMETVATPTQRITQK